MARGTAVTEAVLAGLDDRQLEAVTRLRGPVCVLAGAGTGKTRVITHRIAHGVDTGAYSPERVMAVTFTTKAAGEMRGRLRALGVAGVAARTFHATALAQLNYFWPQLAGDTAPGILDGKARVLALAAETVGLDPDRATLRDVAGQIEWRKVTMRSIEDWAAARPDGVGGLGVERVVDLQRAYERLKDERRQLDFEDVLLACAGMLEAEPRVSAAVREQYRHFTVDEFQDVSPVQERLLELWLGDRRDLCVVGDVSQTVYSFAGADPRYLLDFAARHPDAHVVRLERNHRSAPEVLAVANALMRGRPGALELRAADARGPAPAPRPVPRSHGAPEPPPVPEPPPAPERRPVPEPVEGPAARDVPTVTAYADERDEARGVALRIAEQLAAGVDPRQVAVLYRANAQSAEILGALGDRGIPATVVGGVRFFDLPEVRQALVAIRGAAIAPTAAGVVDTVRDVLRAAGFTDDPPAAGGALREAWEARRAVLRLAEEAPAGTGIRAFADDLASRARDAHEPGLATVTLATLHAAKGLEWPHVHLVGMAEGLLPISYATTFDAVDEERRLAYVGITRAARTLSLSWARGSGRLERQPSRFLREIGRGTLREVGAPARSVVPPPRAASRTATSGRRPAR